MRPMIAAATGSLATAVLVAALGCWIQPHESASCQSNIVSSTVVATFCGHAEHGNEMLDLLILWRGSPGWFLRHGPGGGGTGGSMTFGAGTKGVVSQYQTYGDVTIAFDADFDTNAVAIGSADVKLDHINTVVVDDVDTGWRVTARRWTDPRLPLGPDVNLSLAQRSRAVRADLNCAVPMPAAPVTRFPVQQARVVTVCEKLKTR
jgi:hypothetical protein